MVTALAFYTLTVHEVVQQANRSGLSVALVDVTLSWEACHPCLERSKGDMPGPEVTCKANA